MKNEENKKLGADENPHINLKVKGIGEKEVLYRIKRSTQLKKLMNAYCNMKYHDFNSVMFLFNGYQLRAEQTPLELDMEDGDEIDAIIDASDDDEKEECCSTHLIDEDGTFNAVGLDNFIKKVKLGECGISYAVVAIMGPQSSGKSTLLNHLFHTDFREMDAYKGRSQTTKGIWIARCAGIEPCTIVMDLEGTNGIERGENDTAFEKQSALFALAVSDIVLINMWCHDIGLEQAANKPLLKTVFQVMLRLFIPRKTSLLFVIRDKTRTPLEILEPVLREDIQKIWDSIPKPEAHKHTPLSIFFNVQVVALSSYEDKEEQFKEQVAGFRQKFFQSIPGGLAGDRRGVVPASGFSFSAQHIWKVIKENKDLDLLAHKVMVATVLCDEIARKKYSSFVANKDWHDLQKVLQSLFIPKLGEKLSSLLYNCLSSYDEEATYFEDSVRSAKRKQLEENLMQLVQPAYQLMLGHILPEMLENFKKALNDALGGGLGFAVAARDCSKEFIRQFDEKYGNRQVFWDLAKVRDKLSCDLDSQIAQIRTAKLSELSSLYESEMKEALYGPVEALLKGGRDDTWPAIRNLLHQETAKAVSEFSFALSGFEIGKQEKENIISNLKNYSRGLVEGKAREEAGKVLYHMKERFTYIIKHDDDSMPRVWTGKEDIQAITKNAQSSSLSLLSMLAAIRLDEETDTIRDTLGLTLMDPRIGNSKSCDLRDSLASSTWEEVPATKTLITPAECKSLWNQFKKETEYTIAQPIASQMPHAVGSLSAQVHSTSGGDSVPSSALRGRSTSSRGPCTSGSDHVHDFGERGGRGGRSIGHSESLKLDDMMNVDSDIFAEELEVGLDGDGADFQGSQMTQTSGRGENVRPLPRVNPAHRREISIERDGGFNITKATRMCTTILRECFHGPWCYWSEVPRENRQIMFERFAAYYCWDPSLNEAIYRRWEYVNSVRLRDMLREARWKAAKVARQTTGGVFEFPTLDFEVIRAFNPSWIRVEDWNGMIDRVWNTEEWKAKARAAQANRNTKHGETSARHTGGSISFSQHRIRMREETGVEPELDEVFMRTHTRIDPVTGERTWPYPKAREVYEAYKRRHEGASSSGTTQVDSGNLWKQIAGGRKKSRIFGAGTSTDPHYTLTGEPETPNTERSYLPATPAHPVGLENRVAELEELTHRLLAEINQLRGRPEQASQHNTPPSDPCV